jgi:hypothetical protein
VKIPTKIPTTFEALCNFKRRDVANLNAPVYPPGWPNGNRESPTVHTAFFQFSAAGPFPTCTPVECATSGITNLTISSVTSNSITMSGNATANSGRRGTGRPHVVAAVQRSAAPVRDAEGGRAVAVAERVGEDRHRAAERLHTGNSFVRCALPNDKLNKRLISEFHLPRRLLQDFEAQLLNRKIARVEKKEVR